MKNKPKILLVGYGRHGKDTVAEILELDYQMKFQSSSMYCSESICFPALSPVYGYKNAQECFNDRHNHREEWYQLISRYCEKDYARLGREVFASYDIYCGLRNKKELDAMRSANVFDYAIWIDRSHHLPPESESSNSIKIEMADYVIDNNSTLEALTLNVHALMDTLL